MALKDCDRVCWTLKDGSMGFGRIISVMTAPHEGYALVAVDPKPDAPSAFVREVHPVIFCTVTWLSPLGV